MDYMQEYENSILNINKIQKFSNESIPLKLKEIFIERCERCDLHQWCTKHDETKYINNVEDIKNYISECFT